MSLSKSSSDAWGNTISEISKIFLESNKLTPDTRVRVDLELIQKADRYLDLKFGSSKFDDMPFYFITLIDIKDRFIEFNNLHRTLKETISDLLYWYSKPKLISIIKISQFALLMHRFLNNKGILKLVIKSKNDAMVIQTYWEIIQNLKSQCNITLSTLTY